MSFWYIAIDWDDGGSDKAVSNQIVTTIMMVCYAHTLNISFIVSVHARACSMCFVCMRMCDVLTIVVYCNCNIVIN